MLELVKTKGSDFYVALLNYYVKSINYFSIHVCNIRIKTVYRHVYHYTQRRDGGLSNDVQGLI